MTWDEYLDHPGDAYRECSQLCADSFAEERKALQKVVERVRPRTVVCLGAGVLNDIPYSTLVHSGATVHLVDWLPRSLEQGLKSSILTRASGELPRCLFCSPEIECPQQWCTNYRTPNDPKSTTCPSYVPDPGDTAICASFGVGTRTSLHCEDVTAGYASDFARTVGAELQGVRSWRQALGRAQATAERAKRRRIPLSIPAGSAQLVTSSMLISQFEHEPYGYFSRQAAEILGPPGKTEESALQPVLESLRSTLLVNQVERHCEEILRMLASGGVCYMSFELFHYYRPETTWFLVRAMHEALGVLGRRFHFNFDVLDRPDCVARFDASGEPSLVFRFLLEPLA